MILFQLFLIASLCLVSIKYPLLYAFLALILFINRKSRHIRALLICSCLSIIVSLINHLYNPGIDGTHIGLVIKAENNYIVIQTIRGRYYIGVQTNSYEIGDVIRATGHSTNFNFSYVEKGFNFNQYLQNQGIKQQVIPTNIDLLLDFPIQSKAIRTRVLSNYSADTQVLIEALIFNNKNYESRVIARFENLDLLFMLSTSGLHIYFFTFLCGKLMGLFTTKSTDLTIIPLLLLVPLWIINLDKFIFYRLFLVKGLNAYNHIKLKGRYNYLTIVSLSGLIFLAIDPHLIYNMSFYISYGLTLFIYFLRPLLKRHHKWIQSMLLALFIYLFLIPIRVAQANYIMPFSFLLQLALGPILGLYFVLGYVGVMMGGRGGLILNLLTGLIQRISESLSVFEFGFSVRDLGVYGSLLYVCLVFFLVFAYEIKHRPWINLGLSVMSVLSVFVCSSLTTLIKQSVTFINVGQGDATLIQSGNTAVLIDTGGSHYIDIAKESLIPYFRSQKIADIDIVFITHDDFDHSGALATLEENFKVKRVVREAHQFPIMVGGLSFHNLNQANHYEEDNEKSLIIYFDFIGKKWLFMGDASVNNEKDIIQTYKELKVDILKVGHHGSNTSSSLEFLQYVEPKVAIISAGMNNYYGHPHSDVLTNLASLHIQVRRTDVEGTIVYKSFFF